MKELLSVGVSLRRVAELSEGHVDEKELHAIAREVVTQSSAPHSELGLSAARDTDFVDKHMTNLTSEAPEELLDPLLFTLMQEPVILSSGYVVDKSTALDEHGQLRFRRCPFTRAQLKPDVYPLVDRRRRLQEFKEKRFDAMTSTAEALMAEGKFAEFDQVVEAAERLLDDLGVKTYFHQAQMFAEMRRLRAGTVPGRSVPPMAGDLQLPLGRRQAVYRSCLSCRTYFALGAYFVGLSAARLIPPAMRGCTQGQSTATASRTALVSLIMSMVTCLLVSSTMEPWSMECCVA